MKDVNRLSDESAWCLRPCQPWMNKRNVVCNAEIESTSLDDPERAHLTFLLDRSVLQTIGDSTKNSNGL
jgi:hypothetical protein